MAPGYRELYHRWEREAWEAEAIDLAADARRWPDLAPGLRDALVAGLRLLQSAAAASLETLAAIAAIASGEEHQIALSTHLADAARAALFLDRFLDGVAGDAASPDGRVEGLDGAGRELIAGALPAAARAAARSAGSAPVAEGVVLHHLLVQGVVTETTATLWTERLRVGETLPGLGRGLAAVGRDAARHADFGARYVSEAAADPAGARAADAALERWSRAAVAATADAARPGSLPYPPMEVEAHAADALARRVDAIRAATR